MSGFKVILRSVLLIVLMAIIQAEPSQAQWSRTNGPGGGNMNAIIAIGNHLFAGSEFGVWHSTDGGDSWAPMYDFGNPNVFNVSVKCFATDSVNIYAGTGLGYIYKANINNPVWTATSYPATNFVLSLQFMDNKLYAGTSGGVYMTADSGSTWVQMNSGMTNTQVLCMAANDNFLFAGSSNGGLYRLANGASNWVDLSFGTNDIKAILIDSPYVYVSTASKVKRTADNGISWLSLNTGLPPNFSAASFAKFDGYLYASSYYDLYRSSNNAFNWTQAPGSHGTITNAFSVQDSFLFGATNDAGVERLQMGGNTWELKLNGINNSEVQDLAVQNQKIIAATINGVFTTDDGGNSWNGPILPGGSKIINSITTNDSLIFAGTYYDAVFRSTNGGASWTWVKNGLPICFNNGSVLEYCSVPCIQIIDNYVFAVSYNGVYRMPLMGNTWDTINTGLTTYASHFINNMEVVGSNLYIGTADGVYVSYNSGASWNSLNIGLPTNINYPKLTSIGNHVFVSISNEGLFSYTEGDTTWLPVNLGNWNLSTYFGEINHAGHFLFANANQENIVSDDLGLTWTAVGNSLESNRVFDIVNIGTDMYAATNNRGVYKNSTMLTEINETIHTENCKIYPNPVNSKEQIINLECGEFNGKVDAGIYDLRGSLVRQLPSIAGNDHKYNLGNIPAGFYILRIIDQKKVRAFKILVR